MDLDGDPGRVVVPRATRSTPCWAPRARRLAVTTTPTGAAVRRGLSCRNSEPRHSVCTPGWWTGRAHRAQGYGTETVRAAIAALHEEVVRAVAIATLPTNTPVRRVAERLGMRQDASRAFRLPNGKWVSAVFYVDGISDAEWTTAG